MQPNQNPYEFITNESVAPRKNIFNSGSMKSRIILVSIIALVILVAILVGSSLLGRGKQTNADRLYLLNAQQLDLIDITKIGADKVRDRNANLTMSTANATLSSQNVELAKITKNITGNKKPEKIILLKRDTKFKKTLESAESSGKYEETFLGLYANKLDAYATQLKGAYATSSGKTKEKLGAYYRQLDAIKLTQPDQQNTP